MLNHSATGEPHPELRELFGKFAVSLKRVLVDLGRMAGWAVAIAVGLACVIYNPGLAGPPLVIISIFAIRKLFRLLARRQLASGLRLRKPERVIH